MEADIVEVCKIQMQDRWSEYERVNAMNFLTQFMKNVSFTCPLVTFAFSISFGEILKPLDRGELTQSPASDMQAEETERSIAAMPNGSVVELFIRDASGRENCLIDFDTGRILSYPPDENLCGDRKALEQWIRDNGVDAMASARDRTLYGRDIIVMPADSSLWSDRADESLISSKAWKWFRESRMLTSGAYGNFYARAFLPATYMFDTMENGIGLIQIFSFSDSEPQGLTVRYRMIGRSHLEKDRKKIRHKLHSSLRYAQAFVQACLDYSLDHNNILPGKIADLKDAYPEQTAWAEKNIVYVAGGIDISKMERPGEIPVSYSSMDFGTGIISRISFLNGRSTFTDNLNEYVSDGAPIIKSRKYTPHQAIGDAVTFPSGLKVELPGLSRIPTKSSPFWSKDGTLLDSPIFDSVVPITSGDRKFDPGWDLLGYYAMSVRLSGEAVENIDGIVKWDLIRSISAYSTTGRFNGKSLYDQNMFPVSAMFLKDTADTTVRVGIAAGDWRTIASGKHHGVYQHNGNMVIVGAPSEQGGPLGILSMGPGIYIGIHYYVGEMEFRAIAIDKDNKIHFSQQSGGRGKMMKLWYTNAVFPGLNYEDLKEFQFQVRPYEWAEFRNVPLRPNVTDDI